MDSRIYPIIASDLGSGLKRIPVSVLLMVLSSVVVIPNLNISSVRGSGSGSWSFRDDFNYTSISQVQAAGWTINPNTNVPSSYYGFHNSTLTLNSHGDVAATVSRSDVPTNVTDWSVSIRGDVIGTSYATGYSIQLLVPTVGHVYTWRADGSSGNLILYRDYNVQVASFMGYTPQLNVWHTLQLDMIHGTLNMYFDGMFIGNYEEPDKTTGNTALSGIKLYPATWMLNGYDWIHADNSPTPPVPFFKIAASPASISLAYRQPSNVTIQLTSEAGFTGSVNLTASSPSQGPSAKFTPATVGLPSYSSASSTLTLTPPHDPISTTFYTINVTAITSGISRSLTISVRVNTQLPIFISGNSGFTAANGVTGGTGTASDPYILSSFTIDLCRPGKYCGASGIVVNGTTAYFVIRNVYVHRSSGQINAVGYYDADVYLTNVVNAKVENSILTDSRSGITVEGSRNVTLSENSLSDSPLYWLTSGGETLQITGPCISIDYSVNITVTGNTMSPCVGGLETFRDSNLVAYGNTFSPWVSINSALNFYGTTVTTLGSLSNATGTFSGTVQVTATNNSTGAFLFSKTYTITNLSSINNQVSFILNVGVSPYPLSSDVTVSLKSGTWIPNVSVTRQLDVAGDGSIDVVDLATIASHFDSKVGTAGYSPSADVAARGTIDIVDLANVALYFDAPVYR